MKIYVITNNINSKQYVGLTTRPIKERFQEHCRSNRKTTISKAIQKYGKDNFTIEEIDSCENITDLRKKEALWILHKNTYLKGYNETLGGEDQPMFHESIRKKCSDRQMGKNNSFYNKTHSEELKEKWSKNRRGEKHGMYGKKRPELALSNKNRVWTEEAKGKISTKNSKPILCIELNKKFKSITDMCKELNLDPRSVYRVLKGTFKQHKGFTFKYL